MLFVVGWEVFTWNPEKDVVINPFQEWVDASCMKEISSSISH
jgi:uncharacterized membrane protein YhdT